MSVEERVNELEERVALLESQLAEDNRHPSRDQYDSFVIDRLSQLNESFTTRKLMKLYRRAGVKRKYKIRNRIKDLADADLIEKVGDSHWRYVGPTQDRLEVTS